MAPDEGVRVLVGDLLDVHPAHHREHRERFLLRAVEDDRGVVLGVDLGRLLNPELMDLEGPLAMRSSDLQPKDRAGVLFGLLPALGALDSARLAPSADLDLCLYDARIADLICGRDCLLDRLRVLSPWHRDPVPREQLLALILEQIQNGGQRSGEAHGWVAARNAIMPRRHGPSQA